VAEHIQSSGACVFCGRGEDDAATQLLGGPGDVAICHGCVRLCVEIMEASPPAPSRVQEATIVLEDGSQHVIALGLREAVLTLGRDDTAIVAFELATGGRLAVRRQAVRQIHAADEPGGGPSGRSSWQT
jgi:hypothetical protein